MRDRIATARVARFATVDAAGRPHIVPCCFALDGAVVYTAVDGKPKSTLALRRLANVRANPQVSLLVDHYEDHDWSALWWVRVDGSARILDPTDDRAAALDVLAAKYPQYRDVRPPGAVIAVDILGWRSWP